MVKQKMDTFLEASATEVKNLIGKRYYDSCELKVGDAIQVTKRFEQLESLANKQTEITMIQEKLARFSDELNTISPVLCSIIEQKE